MTLLPLPALRGEGWGEGQPLAPTPDARKPMQPVAIIQSKWLPLTLTLSPQVRGEGTRKP
jgi:hypothetical protein